MSTLATIALLASLAPIVVVGGYTVVGLIEDHIEGAIGR